jgi:hypothetical protein
VGAGHSEENAMNFKDAAAKAGQILDEERIYPTVRYALAAPVNAASPVVVAISQRGVHPRTVKEHPENFLFRSTNFDLLCALVDQLPEQTRPALFVASLSRLSSNGSFRDRSNEVSGAGQWIRCSSELPLVAEFAVRRGDKQLFIRALGKAALSPGLTLLLLQLEEMIALNFTLFNEEEHTQLGTAMESMKGTIPDFRRQAPPGFTIETNTVLNVCKEIPAVCAGVAEACRKARFLFLKGALLPGMNLEINQDKSTVRTFLKKLGFTELLIQSLDEAERLYREATTPFDLKNGLGHLRSFLEQLHLQACAAAVKKFGGSPPSKWGEALKYLRDNDVLAKQEELFAAHLYTLMSDTGVHPLIAEREYARLMRNMSIEYGLLVLTKLEKLGLT